MNLIIFVLPYLIFILTLVVLKNIIALRHVAKDNVIEENLKTADQYEIAFLKGGKNLSVDLAFYHLLNSGYLEKTTNDEPNSPKYRFRFIAGKDVAALHDFEKEVVSGLNVPTTLYSLYSHEYSSLERYKQKLSGLYLLRVARKTVGLLNKAYICIACIFSISYLIFGTPTSLLLRIILVVLVNLNSLYIIWEKILCGELYFDGMLLTSAGEKYIKLFEKKYFPLPNFKSDQLFKETQEFNPCST